MDKILVVIDAQVDFTTGCLGSKQAAEAVVRLQEYLKNHKNDYKLVLATADTHQNSEFDEKSTIEGSEIPKHCIKASPGYALAGDIAYYVDEVIEKSTFMADNFDSLIDDICARDYDVEEIDICGFCTDICVISNALLLRKEYPDVKICVIDDLCAGTSEQNHKAALDVMSSCLIEHCASDRLGKKK